MPCIDQIQAAFYSSLVRNQLSRMKYTFPVKVLVKRDEPNASVTVILETDWYSNSTMGTYLEYSYYNIVVHSQYFESCNSKNGNFDEDQLIFFLKSVSNRAWDK